LFKIELTSKAKFEGGARFSDNFDSVFLDFMTKEFKLKKVIKNKIESALLATNLYLGDSYAISIFKKAIRFGDSIRRELVDLYLTVVKEIPIPLLKILNSEDNPMYVDLNFLIKIYTIFLKDFELNKYLLDEIFSKSKFVIDNLEVNVKSKKERRDFYYMANFYTTYFVYFEELAHKYSNGEDEPIELFIHYFCHCNKMFELSEEYSKELISNCIEINDGKIDLQSLFRFYSKKYEVKMLALDYIKITFDYLMTLFRKMEKTFLNYFEGVDINENGFLNFLEFEKLVFLILKEKAKDNRWKVREFYK